MDVRRRRGDILFHTTDEDRVHPAGLQIGVDADPHHGFLSPAARREAWYAQKVAA